jgi:hypothetical protein
MPFAGNANALLGLVALVAIALACTSEHGHTAQPIARVGDEPLHASVIDQVAARDGVDADEARQRVADVLRLVAAARAEREGIDDPADLVSQHRVAHLERAARARLWLETDFEPKHRPSDIPADHPLLARARTSKRHVHPRVHMICQVIAMPLEELDDDARAQRAGDASWRQRAKSVLDPIADRLRRHLPERDAEACKLIQQWVRLEGSTDDDVRLRVESGGFDLEACGEEADDGSCLRPQFTPRWTEPVSRAEGPGFLPPFFTEFGLHLVYVVDILAPRSLDDPETDAYLREQVHEQWQREQFAAYVQRLREKRAVRLAPPSTLHDGDPEARTEP